MIFPVSQPSPLIVKQRRRLCRECGRYRKRILGLRKAPSAALHVASSRSCRCILTSCEVRPYPLAVPDGVHGGTLLPQHASARNRVSDPDGRRPRDDLSILGLRAAWIRRLARVAGDPFPARLGRTGGGRGSLDADRGG